MFVIYKYVFGKISSNLQCTFLKWKWAQNRSLADDFSFLLPFLDGLGKTLHPPPVPGSRLVCVWGLPKFSSKDRLTSAGARETFNLASFLELREEKRELPQGQRRSKGTLCFLEEQWPTLKEIKGESPGLQASRKSFTMIIAVVIKCPLCATHMLSVYVLSVYFMHIVPSNHFLMHLTMFHQYLLNFDLCLLQHPSCRTTRL